MRLLAIGKACLTEGFSLLGFETYPDATPESAETIFCQLLAEKTQALVFVEHYLLQKPGACYKQLRQESCKVLLVEIPPLESPDQYQPAVENLLRRVLGHAVLD